VTPPGDGAARESAAVDWAAAADLVRRIQAGDAQAESELVARYARGVTLIIARGCRDRSAVDDLCQDTFRIAIERLRRGELREPERLSGFMCSLARNLVTEHFRRVARDERLAAADPDPPADAGPSPLDALEKAELAASVRQLLAELPTERDRLVLFRYYVAEEASAAISADLGLTRVHFNRVLFRARERFRELYERARAPHDPAERMRPRTTLSKRETGLG
jgi:RNA polymerase sigma-70 factor (ECF subfamily)